MPRKHGKKGEEIHTQANDFAVALLMPDDEFMDFVRNISSNIGDIAEHFQVPSMAVRIKAQNLGLKGHDMPDREC